MGGLWLARWLWWKIDFDNDKRNHLPANVQGRDDLCINVWQLLALVTAWPFTIDAKVPPIRKREYPYAGDNMLAVH